MDGHIRRPHHALVRVLPHVKKLDDALGDFIVRVTCPCGAPRRNLAPADNVNAVPPHRVESGPPQPSAGVTACVSNPQRVCDVMMILAGPVLTEACAPQSKQPSVVLL